MVQTVTVNTNTYSDGDNDGGVGNLFLGNGGHRVNFIDLVSDTVVDIAKVEAAALDADAIIAAYDQFDDTYLGAKASDPALDNDGDALITGAMYFNTAVDNMRIYNSLNTWVTAAGVSNPDFSITRETFAATASQTVFTLAQAYNVGTNTIMVYVNGVRMKLTTDYAETNTTTITFTTGLTLSDDVLFEHGVVSNGTSPAAGNVVFTPTGTIASGNVQDAVAEVSGDVTTINSDYQTLAKAHATALSF